MHTLALLLKNLASILEKKDELTNEELSKLTEIFDYLRKITKLGERVMKYTERNVLYGTTEFKNLEDLTRKLSEAYMGMKNTFIRTEIIGVLDKVRDAFEYEHDEIPKEVERLIGLMCKAFNIDIDDIDVDEEKC